MIEMASLVTFSAILGVALCFLPEAIAKQIRTGQNMDGPLLGIVFIGSILIFSGTLMYPMSTKIKTIEAQVKKLQDANPNPTKDADKDVEQ